MYESKIFDAVTIAASENSTSGAIDLSVFGGSGFMSLQVAITGDGTAKAEYLVSNDGSDYLDPVGAADIYSSFTKTSGTGTNGKDLQSFSVPAAGFLKIKITETGGANSITISAWGVIK